MLRVSALLLGVKTYSRILLIDFKKPECYFHHDRALWSSRHDAIICDNTEHKQNCNTRGPRADVIQGDTATLQRGAILLL